MGCDIHVFPEISRAGVFQALTQGEFNIPRDYAVFAALAGVRAPAEVHPLIAPRGFPENASPPAFCNYYRPVLSTAEAEVWRLAGYVTPDEILGGRFEKALTSRRSSIAAVPRGWVCDPDRHHASWLQRDEVRRCLLHARISEKDCPAELNALLDAMCSLEKAFEGAATRIVFWFEN